MCKEKKRKEEREKRKEETEKRKEKKSNNCDVGQPSADNIEAEGNLVMMDQRITDIGTSRLLRNLEKRLLEDYKGEASKLEVGESSVRHLILVNLLVHGAGQRPSAFTRMTIKEFLNAKHNNGMLEVVVADHKTKGVYKCQIPILRKPVEQLMRLYLTHSRG